MSPLLLTTLLRSLTLAAVLIACGGSFGIGYYVGFRDGCLDSWTRVHGSQVLVPLSSLNATSPAAERE
jgi:hypothetical protein